MKWILALCVLFLAYGCDVKDFDIVGATSQKWTGGRPESGRGIDYEIKLKAHLGSDILKIDRLWIGDSFYKVRVFKLVGTKQVKDFKKGDEILVKASFVEYPSIAPEKRPKNKTEKIELPQKYNGAALIGYTLKDKRLYKEVKKIEKLKNMNHQ